MEQGTSERVQLNMDNGSASSGGRTPWLHRLGPCVDTLGQPIQRLYDPPYPSTYTPMERCWGVREVHGHGPPLSAVETMLAGAKRMTWQGGQPIGKLSRKVSAKGVSLRKAAMRAVEAR